MKLSWPIKGASRASLNKADKKGERDGDYGSPGSRGKHAGIDIKAPTGTAVLAAGKGVVVKIEPNPSASFGNQLVIEHEVNKLYTAYCHLQESSSLVAPGDNVSEGQHIANVGRTGNTPTKGDSHLHFEVRLHSKLPRAAGGTVDNPFNYLPA